MLAAFGVKCAFFMELLAAFLPLHILGLKVGLCGKSMFETSSTFRKLSLMVVPLSNYLLAKNILRHLMTTQLHRCPTHTTHIIFMHILLKIVSLR
jgi:hypothetical protein